MCVLQNALSAVVGQVELVSKLSCELLKLVTTLTTEAEETDSQLAEQKFLSEYRDYVRAFRDIIVETVGVVSWERLSRYLIKEEGMPKDQQPYTTAVERALTDIGFTMEDWSKLRKVADASVTLFHRGETNRLGYKAALARLKTGVVPQRLHDTKEVLQKALEYINNQ